MIRSKPLMQAARDAACVRCGAEDGTVVRAHYCGLRQFSLGKGTGHKCHDIAGAELCRNCHDYFDFYENEDNSDEGFIARSEEFLFLILMTLVRNIKNGVITVKGYKP